MAKAHVIEPKPVKQPPRKIILELTKGEADMILAVMATIGGEANKSPRKYSTRVYSTLRDALGYTYEKTDAYKLLDRSSTGIWFRRYPSNKPVPDHLTYTPSYKPVGYSTERIHDYHTYPNRYA